MYICLLFDLVSSVCTLFCLPCQGGLCHLLPSPEYVAGIRHGMVYLPKCYVISIVRVYDSLSWVLSP